MTNRILARFVDRAYISFDETEAVFGKTKSVMTGNPVRHEFVEHARLALADPEGFEARARNVLILGGSQGARKLNEDVPHALARIGPLPEGGRIVHQTGQSMRDDVEATYRELGIEADVVTFIDDMARAYSNASLVIARAGATTLAELCAIGRPSVLIPFPFAADDHQAKNAEALERLGAAVCIRESNLERESLGRLIEELLGDEARRRSMSDAARAHGKPDAAAAIVDDMLAWLDGGQGMGDPEPIPSSGASGGPVRALSAAPAYHLASPEMLLRPVSHRPRRPVVVDGAVWE
jgi:UDP-N-acetylglucosamine--N-acetylmuramyl-(pentapeptide) pyrophosphoryl-undecaprenol N-acetylglucosamine transferase